MKTFTRPVSLPATLLAVLWLCMPLLTSANPGIPTPQKNLSVETWYRDLDGDGYGDPFNTSGASTAPTGYVATAGDCNDNNAAVNPGAIETCDGIDNNCDGFVDNGVGSLWYEDADGDLYGNPAVFIQSCAKPAGYVADNTDCNDNVAGINPATTWYQDADGDTYGTSVTFTGCTPPAGYARNSGDCDDTNAALNPETTWYADADEDGFGSAAGGTVQGCAQPTGSYSLLDTDCNDANYALNPNTKWYTDADNDGFGNIASFNGTGCALIFGSAPNGGDCNDSDPAITMPNTVASATGTAATYYADRTYTNAAGWTYYYSCANNLMLLVLKQRGWNPGTLVQATPTNASQYAVRVDVGAANAVNLLAAASNTPPKAPNYYLTTTSWVVMNRTWDVQLNSMAQQPNKKIGVRSCYTQADYDAINAILPPTGQLPGHGFITHYKLVNVSPPSGNLYLNSISALNDYHDLIDEDYIISYHPSRFGYNYAVGTIGTSGYYAEYDVTSFSGGGGGGGLGGAGAFPVELSAFSAEASDRGAFLSWTTASEQNMSHFAIEQSIDNNDFVEIGAVQAVGNSSALQAYDFLDVSASGKVYYRLRMVEMDGKISYSNIEEIHLKGVNTIRVAAQPNPFSEALSLQINSQRPGMGTIAIFDMLGQKLTSMHQVLDAGHNEVQVPVGGLATGVYFVRVTQGGQVAQQKIVKN